MVPLQATIMILVALGALAVALTTDLVRLVIVSSAYTLLLVVLFVILQAPDVALSMLVVGTVGYPIVLLVAIRRDRADD
ncbi:MAG TPA: hydrogenase subunit MbhD domain-containing protein [Gaiellaceae bacterium]|nr:hydrogenase subunit MbhD domain-containing protein [Gaiellaceae bacterium]